MKQQVELSEAPRLITEPQEDIYSLSKAKAPRLLTQIAAEFNGAKQNFEDFIGLLERRQLLTQIVSLTSIQSFMDYAFRKVEQTSSFANSMFELLNGKHSTVNNFMQNLPFFSMYFTSISSTPIPENIEQLVGAEMSLTALQELSQKNPNLIDAIRRAAVPTEIEEDGSIVNRNSGISIKVLGGNTTLTPQNINRRNLDITVDNERLFVSLPVDRNQYLSVIGKPGTKIGLEITNTGDSPILFLPAINGIPMVLESIELKRDDFSETFFPVSGITAIPLYINPGEKKQVSGFHCNRINIVQHANSIGSDIVGSASYSLGAFLPLCDLATPLFLRNLESRDRETLNRLLTDPEDAGLGQKLLRNSVVSWLTKELSRLKNAFKTDIILTSPIDEAVESSQDLANPFYGSISMAVVKVEPPPVEPRQTFDYHNLGAATFGGPTILRGGGGGSPSFAGLAGISGSEDQSAGKISKDYKYDSWTHTFSGMISINLLSTGKFD